jgi:hypothetical protein
LKFFLAKGCSGDDHSSMPLMAPYSSLKLGTNLGELLGLPLITDIPERPSLNTDEDSEKFNLESSQMKPMLSTLLEN